MDMDVVRVFPMAWQLTIERRRFVPPLPPCVVKMKTIGYVFYPDLLTL